MPAPVLPSPLTATKAAEEEYRRAIVRNLIQPTQEAYRLAVEGASDEAVKEAMLRMKPLTETQRNSLNRAVNRQASRVRVASDRKWRTSMRRALPEERIAAGNRAGRLAASAWRHENREILQRVRAVQTGRMLKLVGLEGDALKRALRKELGIQKRRVSFVATWQTERLVGKQSEMRQLAAGVGEYTWVTRDDERVRPSHARLHGKTRSWSEEPKPGQEPRCRCAAAANIDARGRGRMRA